MNPWLIAALVGVGVGLMLGKGSPYAAVRWPALRYPRTTGSRNPPGTEYAPEHLPMAWPRTEDGRRAFVKYMLGLLAAAGLTGLPAVLFIAHVARETGYGRAVYGHNFGNIKEYGSGPWHRLTDGQPYKTYSSPLAGILDNIAFLRDRNGGRYRAAWNKLLAGDVSWYGTMGLAGYFQCHEDGRVVDCDASNIGPAQADYAATLRGVERYAAA